LNERDASFLFEIDKQGQILNIFWYHPAYLISPYQKTLESIFQATEHARLRQLLNHVLDKNETMICNERFRMISPEMDISICLSPVEGKILMVGYDYDVFSSEEEIEYVRTLVGQFMRVVRALDTDILTKSEMMIRDQFEQIQKLNNELLNMQRQLKKANAQLNRLNQELNNRLVKDALTGLVSRYQYREEIELVISKMPKKLGIFVFIDIDNFKRINDTYGHNAGDEYLKTFADRLNQLPFADTVAMRIAGDEFGLYIHGYERVGVNETEEIWQVIKEKVITEPIVVGKYQEIIRCSVGMAVYNLDTEDVYELIEFADFAMYEAKQSGKNASSIFDKNRYIENKKYMR